MRRQYYLVPVAGHRFDAWDVHRLVELVRGFPIEDHPLDALAELDEPAWTSEGRPLTLRDVAEHMVLIRAVDPSHPVILSAEGRVMDGRHRIARAVIDGRTALPAVRFAATPEPDHRGVLPNELIYD